MRNMIDLVGQLDVKIKYERSKQHGYSNEKLIKRIWDNIDKKGEDDCWLWRGGKTLSGYGRISYGDKVARVHRLVYIQTYGEIHEDKPFITHACNNPLCCNPKHLRADTPKGNSRYMVDCDRQAKGENNGNSKLTIEEINEIRNLYNMGEYSYEILAEMFNITKPAIARIVRNEVWKDGNYKRMHDTKIGRERELIHTKELRDKIKEEYLNGLHQRHLAEKYNLSKGTIYNILHNKLGE